MSTCICGQSNFTEHQYIVCSNCQRYIHLECANLLWYQAKEIYIFYCQFCRPYTGPSLGKAVTNHHRNDRTEESPELLPLQTGTPDFISYLKKFSSMNDARHGDIRKMRGQQLSVKELVISGFDKPILIETKDGLEVVTPPGFSIDTLSQHYAANYCVEAIEVTRQIKVKLKLSYLLTQFTIFSSGRTDVFQAKLDLAEKENLSEQFSPPRIVRKLSWVDQYWPNVPFKPLLSKYCFITMENSFTDFHIDLGGASAWYHVIQGEQIFYLIEPTKENLGKFEHWLRSPSKETMLFATTEKTYKSKVSTGETIFIPNGWIYAMMSPADSITFGGFFLHSLSISTQLAINDFLQTLNAPELAFPSYELTNWYAAPNILKLAKESFKNQPPKHLLEGIEALSEKLRQWLHKSKRDDSAEGSIVPKAINCSKLVRDLNICVRSAKSKNISAKEKTTAGSGTSPAGGNIKAVKSKAHHHHHQQAGESGTTSGLPLLDPDETRIKDLVKHNSSSKGGSGRSDEGSSALKITFNMKLAQDVIRRSLDDPYDLNNEANDQEFLLIDSKAPSKSKSKKRKRKEENELTRLIEGGRREDETYVYLDDDPEEHSEALRNDKMWEPGSSAGHGGGGGFADDALEKRAKKKVKPKVKKSASISSISQPSTSVGGGGSRPTSLQTAAESNKQSTSEHSSTVEQQAQAAGDKAKKFKKGQATPKQRLAKKLFMRR